MQLNPAMMKEEEHVCPQATSITNTAIVINNPRISITTGSSVRNTTNTDVHVEHLSPPDKVPIIKTKKRRLSFKDRCARCGVKIIQEKLSGEKIQVMLASGKTIGYKDSQCHPAMIPKYTKIVKFIGGMGHIITLGVAVAFAGLTGGVKVWPWFTNAEEICPVCNQPPGVYGCIPVGEDATFGSPAVTIKTDHTKALDNVKFKEE